MTTLEEQEARISKSFIEIGDALRIIRDERLYRQSDVRMAGGQRPTFEEYCDQKWGMSMRHVNRLIEASKIAQSMGPIGPKIQNEGQARELAKVPEEERAEVWEDAWQATDGKPTAKAIREAKMARLDNDTTGAKSEAVHAFMKPMKHLLEVVCEVEEKISPETPEDLKEAYRRHLDIVEQKIRNMRDMLNNTSDAEIEEFLTNA